MARNLKTVENEKHTLQDQEYGKKQWKTWKIGTTHSRTWILVKILKNVENETQTLYDLEYVEKNEKRKKWETHT
jgi:hypothetical protein